MQRREFLKGVGGAMLASALPAHALKTDKRLRLAKVNVSRERVVRTIVGLRPYRPSGYVVRADKLGDKLLVHNYGHGGCGVTLSWGTSQRALELLDASGEKPSTVAILGCGAVGLAMGRLLQERGIGSTIYAKAIPPDTLSNVAGARWYPFDVYDRNTVAPAFLDELWAASRFAFARFSKLLGPQYGIRFLPTYAFRNSPFPAWSLLNFDSPIHELLPGMRDLLPEENPFPYTLVRTFKTMMIEPQTYLPQIIADYKEAKGTIVIREFQSVADIAALKEKVVINCLGFGAGPLFGDTEMFPIKGQLHILPPQPEVDYITLPPDLYMFPRSDGIVLGGSFEKHVATMEPNPVQEDKIINGHIKFFAQMR